MRSSLAGSLLAAAMAVGVALGRAAPEKLSDKVEPDRLRADPAVLMDGQPFPLLEEVKTRFREPRRVFYANGGVPADGDGTEAKPWKDVQKALCRLQPGDRLVLQPGVYSPPWVIGEGCRDGTADAPIQVFGEESFLHGGAEKKALITISRAHWQIWNPELVLGAAATAGVAVSGPGAHDILLDDLHVYDGPGHAVRIGEGASRVTLSNSHIHQSAGIAVTGPAKGLVFIGNKIHHNFAGPISLAGGPAGLVEDVRVSRNKFHNDAGSAVAMSGVRKVRLNTNKIYNYRPAAGFSGTALHIGPDSRDVVVEGSFFAEATGGIRIGETGAAPPADVVIRRNYFENRLTPDGVAVEIVAGRDVRILNNTVNRYAEAFRGPSAAGVGERLTVANNLILDATGAAMRFSQPAALAYLDHNVFSGHPGKVQVQLGSASADVEAHRAAGRMKNSRVQKLDFADRDLAKLGGGSLANAGRPFDALTFQGSAPDIGVAER
ncbi:MAG: right-handed parallel beta-helix repeat-containing protein [Thermoanaerobaculia bacterium]